jgi:hypothetical protein
LPSFASSPSLIGLPSSVPWKVVTAELNVEDGDPKISGPNFFFSPTLASDPPNTGGGQKLSFRDRTANVESES